MNKFIKTNSFVFVSTVIIIFFLQNGHEQNCITQTQIKRYVQVKSFQVQCISNIKLINLSSVVLWYDIIEVGPQGTPYQLGKWKINLYLPEEYPYKSPSVGFLNRIYHPNIDFSSGSVCLDVINQTWTPMYELLNIFEVFLPQLLTYPNPASPLNQQAAHLYETNIQKYNQKVKQHINKHALNHTLVQTRKNSLQILKLQAKKTQQTLQKSKSQQDLQQSFSMDDEGSSISSRNSIIDDDQLKLY